MDEGVGLDDYYKNREFQKDCREARDKELAYKEHKLAKVHYFGYNNSSLMKRDKPKDLQLDICKDREK